MSDADPSHFFNVEKLYLKDLSLEIPHAPMVFVERDVPHIDRELSFQIQSITQELFEVSLTATVTATLKNKTIFLIEIKQAGIFRIRNMEAANLDAVLGAACPNILFPYLREAVMDISVRAGFTPVLLNPVDFEALYQQQKQQQQQAAETAQG
jgi:preprotein translocase subunit SecB